MAKPTTAFPCPRQPTKLSGSKQRYAGTRSLHGPTRLIGLRSRRLQTGTYSAMTPKDPELSVAFVDPEGNVVVETQISVGPTTSPIYLPYFPYPSVREISESLDLVLTNISQSGESIDILVTETVPTEPFYAQAKGVGVEIGPGPNPQIIPRPDRKVFYVERETVEEFKKKYSFKGKFNSPESPEAKAFWAQVTVGRANDLPFENEALILYSAPTLLNTLSIHLGIWHIGGRSSCRPVVFLRSFRTLAAAATIGIGPQSLLIGRRSFAPVVSRKPSVITRPSPNLEDSTRWTYLERLFRPFFVFFS